MADDINKVILSGRLGADPELRVGQNGNAVLSTRMCSTTSYLDKDKQRKERQTWNTVKVFGRRAEGLATFLKKGHYIVVEGSIETGSYDDRDGNKRYTFDVVAGNIVVPPRGEQRTSGGDDGYAPQGRSEGGGYSRGGGNGGGAARAPTDIVESPPDAGGFDDGDIPFLSSRGCGPWRV